MKILKYSILFLFDLYIYIFFVYPLWDSFLITILIFLPLSFALLQFVKHGDGGQIFLKMLDNYVLTAINLGLRLSAFIFFRKNFSNMDIITKAAESPFLFFMSALVGAFTVFTSFMLLYNFLSLLGLIKNRFSGSAQKGD